MLTEGATPLVVHSARARHIGARVEKPAHSLPLNERR